MENGILPLFRHVCRVRLDKPNARQTSAESSHPSRGLGQYNSFNADISEVNLFICRLRLSHASRSIHTISTSIILFFFVLNVLASERFKPSLAERVINSRFADRWSARIFDSKMVGVMSGTICCNDETSVCSFSFMRTSIYTGV